MIEQPLHRTELTHILRGFLRNARFDYEAARVPLERPYIWTRPPFYTDLTLLCHPLQPFLAVRSRCDVEDMADVYERFVDGAVRKRKLHGVDPVEWLGKELKLGQHLARMLFVPFGFDRLRLDVRLNVIAIAALVSYNAECWVEHGPTTFVVRSINYGLEFGIREGQVVSNIDSDFPDSRGTKGLSSDTGRLVDIARGHHPDMPEKVTLFDKARYFADQNASRFGLDADGLKLALTITYWCRGGSFPQMLWSLTLPSQSKAAWERAIDQARNYMNYDDPLVALKDIFVPQFMTLGQFIHAFGNPFQGVRLPPSESMRSKWDEALEDLEPY